MQPTMTVSYMTGHADSNSASVATNMATSDLSATPKSDADIVQRSTTPKNA